MSQEITSVEKLNLSDITNEESKRSSAGSRTPTARSRSDNIKQTKVTTGVTRRVNVKKAIIDNKTKPEPRRRSLTMTDIRNKAQHTRTPIKKLKPDSCSTTDYSPRESNEHPAEVMMTIRRREIQIHTFANMFYFLWRKHKNLTDILRDEVSQLHLQKSFLMNLRDKESERREEITKVAEKQKKEIMDLTEQLSQLTKERDNLQVFCQKLLEEYNVSLVYIRNSTFDLDQVHVENQLVIQKVKEMNGLTNSHIRCTEEIDSKLQHLLQRISLTTLERNIAVKTVDKLSKTSRNLDEKLKNKEENEKNLKETIKELRKLLESSTLKTSDLKSEIKAMKLQLEFAEHELNEQKIRPTVWSDLVRKAARLSMYILHQVGLFPAF